MRARRADARGAFGEGKRTAAGAAAGAARSARTKNEKSKAGRAKADCIAWARRAMLKGRPMKKRRAEVRRG